MERTKEQLAFHRENDLPYVLAALVDAVEGDRIGVAIARRGVTTWYKT